MTAPTPSQGGSSVTVPHANDAVTLVTSTGTYTVFDKVTTGLLCIESLRVSGATSLALAKNISIYSLGGSKLLLVELTPALARLFARALPVYVGGVLQFVLRATGATLSLAQALASVGFLVSALIYDNASLTLAGVPMQLFDINYMAGAGLGQGSGATDIVPLVYTYAVAVSDPRTTTHKWAGPFNPASYINPGTAYLGNPAGGFNFLTQADDSGGLVNPNSYLQTVGASVTMGFAMWYTGDQSTFWGHGGQSGGPNMAWDGGATNTDNNINFGLYPNSRLEWGYYGGSWGGNQNVQVASPSWAPNQRLYVLWTYTRGSANNSFLFGLYNGSSIQPITNPEGTNPVPSSNVGPWATTSPTSYAITSFFFMGPSSAGAVLTNLVFGSFILSAGSLTFAQAFPGVTS